jgi:hypothetical protein
MSPQRQPKTPHYRKVQCPKCHQDFDIRGIKHHIATHATEQSVSQWPQHREATTEKATPYSVQESTHSDDWRNGYRQGFADGLSALDRRSAEAA